MMIEPEQHNLLEQTNQNSSSLKPESFIKTTSSIPYSPTYKNLSLMLLGAACFIAAAIVYKKNTNNSA